MIETNKETDQMCKEGGIRIRRAVVRDIPRLDELLYQVHRVHSTGRPDIFRAGNKKYTDAELAELLANDRTPVFVAVDDSDFIFGYAFCECREVKHDSSLMDRKTIYLDDLCVDEAFRGRHIGQTLYRHVVAEATRRGCDAVTLNVWCLNAGAMRFYEACGMKPLKIVMEQCMEECRS